MLDFLKKLKESFFGKLDDSSKPLAVDSTDLVKIVRNAIIVAIAAALTYVVESVDPSILGNWGPLIMVAIVPVIDFLKKLIKNNSGA